MQSPPSSSAHTLTTVEACALVGADRSKLRKWECLGWLKRVGERKTSGAATILYLAADVEAAAAREAEARKPKPKPVKLVHPPLVIPPGMMTAAQVCERAGIGRDSLISWVNAGRLLPAARVAPPQGGSPHRLFLAADVEALLDVAGRRNPVLRIGLVRSALEGGADLEAALDAAGVSRTTWNWWARHRPDAAALAEQVGDVSEEEKATDLRAVMSAVLDSFRTGASMTEALATQGLTRTTHRQWLAGIDGCEEECTWFAVQYRAIREDQRTRHTADRAAGRKSARQRKAGATGVVYFISGHGRSDAVKIGWTTKETAAYRLATLQVGSPVELRILASVIAFGAFEKWCHRAFAADSTVGEWFRRSPRLDRFMAALRKRGDITGMTPAEISRLLDPPPIALFGSQNAST